MTFYFWLTSLKTLEISVKNFKNYKLDPAHYYTAPGLAWDAALKVTEVKLELLSDIDMLLMVEKGIRGGVSMVSNRYGKANNKYMGNRFDDKEPSKYIAYLDASSIEMRVLAHFFNASTRHITLHHASSPIIPRLLVQFNHRTPSPLARSSHHDSLISLRVTKIYISYPPFSSNIKCRTNPNQQKCFN